MRAVTYAEYGAPDVLGVEELDRPEPGDDEVLIHVMAAEATKSDCEMRSFKYAVKWFWVPLRLALGIRRPRRRILGGYFAGTVAACGKNAEGFSVGDEVFGCCGLRLGAYAEYVALPAGYTIAAKPRSMSFAQAAAVPLGGLNALHFMRLAEIRAGERVLVNGAGGSIGAHAVQIAKSMGADVTGVDASHKREKILDWGADRFIDYTCEDFTTQGDTYDVIFDMVAGSSYTGAIRCLEPNGRYLAGNPRLSLMLRSAFTTRFSDKTVRFAFAGETKEELGALRDLVEEGKVVSIADCIYPMAEAADAHRRVETEERVGAVVIAISETAD
jgi:NADPH:quinone reductase-like Zn-dependent oxidoreductase